MCCSVELWLLLLRAGLRSAARFPPSALCSTSTSRGFQQSRMACVHSGMRSTLGHSAFTTTGLRRAMRKIVVHCLRWSHGVTLNEHHYYQFSHHDGDAVDSETIIVNVVIDDVYFYGWRSGSDELLYSVRILGLQQFMSLRLPHLRTFIER